MAIDIIHKGQMFCGLFLFCRFKWSSEGVTARSPVAGWFVREATGIAAEFDPRDEESQ